MHKFITQRPNFSAHSEPCSVQISASMVSEWWVD